MAESLVAGTVFSLADQGAVSDEETSRTSNDSLVSRAVKVELILHLDHTVDTAVNVPVLPLSPLHPTV